MQKILPKSEYTQINTNELSYLFQNLSTYNLLVVVSATQPATNASFDYVVTPYNGIGNDTVEGICWEKPDEKVNIIVGLIEG